MDTKEKILLAALELFAQNGYAATSTAQIAAQLGITKAALYKHYADKRAIFESILRRMEQQDAERAAQFGLPEGTAEEMGAKYKQASLNALADFACAQFEYWTRDKFAAQFRRMLTLEQYGSAQMAQLYQQYICAGPLGYVSDIFAALGYADAPARAARFYAPMFLFYSLFDGDADAAELDAQLKGIILSN